VLLGPLVQRIPSYVAIAVGFVYGGDSRRVARCVVGNAISWRIDTRLTLAA